MCKYTWVHANAIATIVACTISLWVLSVGVGILFVCLFLVSLFPLPFYLCTCCALISSVRLVHEKKILLNVGWQLSCIRQTVIVFSSIMSENVNMLRTLNGISHYPHPYLHEEQYKHTWSKTAKERNDENETFSNFCYGKTKFAWLLVLYKPVRDKLSFFFW